MANQRLAAFFEDLIKDLHALIEKHQVTHDEYRQACAFLIEVGQATGLLSGQLAAKRPEDLPG